MQTVMEVVRMGWQTKKPGTLSGPRPFSFKLDAGYRMLKAKGADPTRIHIERIHMVMQRTAAPDCLC